MLETEAPKMNDPQYYRGFNVTVPPDTTIHRRVPQQGRGERRVAQLLDTAARVLAEVGYDATTMTEISSRAGSSIGAVYQYFPNKEALVRALRLRYAQDLEQYLRNIDELTRGFTIEEMSHYLIDVISGFIDEHPAYFAVFDAPVAYTQEPPVRIRSKERLAELFQQRNPSLSQKSVYRIANVTMQIVKGMNTLYKDADLDERHALVSEYKLALAGYLSLALTPNKNTSN